MGIMIGSKYKLVNHPNQPIGTTKSWDSNKKEIQIEWDDTSLIPPSDWYPEEMFVNGTFELQGRDHFSMYGYLGDYESVSMECNHDWTSYTGLNVQYEFCKKCDIKRNT